MKKKTIRFVHHYSSLFVLFHIMQKYLKIASESIIFLKLDVLELISASHERKKTDDASSVMAPFRDSVLGTFDRYSATFEEITLSRLLSEKDLLIL